MNKKWFMPFAAAALAVALVACQEETKEKEEATEVEDHNHDDHHDHNHDHAELSEKDKQISQGYFEDSDITDRPLTNWQGEWQSVYPYLLDGTLDGVLEHKAYHGDKTAEEYKEYYKIGYATDVTQIDIADKTMTFYKDGEAVIGTYEYDGYEILTYEKGNRGVRYIFKQVDDSSQAPKYVQFSDHIISDQASGHFHIYFGDDRAKLLEEMDNWPTYYPKAMSGEEIADEMDAHLH
ncbi:metal-binding protein ZinT [Lysinibacillus louembei]|uniref:Metal-binding protein ZinT n=1 Tax=Lysinibacillus louembei TaxID=1470088 RepID=A0ABZ0RZN2_9BACI|nr:metal-binding protein ZinT [Lysinibacillus louembei]WPK13693.1 metal-binding protein ZinT [Lysinibacillus louembei]